MWVKKNLFLSLLAVLALVLTGCQNGLMFFDASNEQTENKNPTINLNSNDQLKSQAYAVMSQNCFTCHGSGGYRGESWDLFTNSEWIDKSFINVDDYMSSQIIDRVKHGSGTGDMPYPMGSSLWNKFSESDYEKIRAWVQSVSEQAKNGDPDVIDGSNNNPETPTTPTTPTTPSNPQIPTNPTTPTTPNPTPNPDPTSSLITMDLRLMDRIGTKAILDDIFGPSAPAVATTAIIFYSLSQFGGPCDPKAQANQGCDGVDAFDTAAPMATFSSTPREGFRMKACNLLSFNDTTLRYAITNARGSLPNFTTNPRPNAADVQSVYQLFYPGRAALPSSVVGELMRVSDLAPVNVSTMDPWRALILTVCYAPDWQAP